MEIIDRENHQKLYIQLINIFLKKMESKEWTIGFKIPTEDELCSMYNVSRATVRTATLELARYGYLKRQHCKGTFVHRNIVSEGLTMLTSFRELMIETGISYSTKVLAQPIIMPIDDLSSKEVRPNHLYI